MPMKMSDEARLEWFFGCGQFVLGGSSGFGAQLERAQLFHVAGPRIAREDVTARPRRHPRREPSFELDDSALERVGWIYKRLKALALTDPLAVEIFETYFGDEGARFGRTKHGRVACLVRFTKSGQRLLKSARKKEPQSPVRITDAKAIESAVLVQDVQPTADRAQLLALALREAEQLYEQACDAWEGRCLPIIAAE